MEEDDRKGSGVPVIASRGEAIQLLFRIATGLKPLAMTVFPLSGSSLSPFFLTGGLIGCISY
jgi:hypothetical protein